jgi:hypothetical protein
LTAPENPNVFLNSGDEALQFMIDRARKNAEDDLVAAQQERRKKEQEARNLVASIFEEAAEIALSGLELGYDEKTCYDIAAAIRLQAAITRGDVS